MSFAIAWMLAGAAPSAPASFDQAAHVAHLNDTLGKEDYKTFGEMVFSPKSQEENRATLNWMKDQWFAGTSSIVPMFYARIL